MALLVAGCIRASAAGGAGGDSVGLGAGQTAPPLSGTTLDGKAFDLASLRGKPVVVNFWASWCIPCRDEFGLFGSALERHAGSGLTIVGVVFKDDAAPAADFVRKQGASWQSVLDPSGAIASRYRVAAPPQTYFIDRSGIVRARQIGEIIGQNEMDSLLAGILG